MPTSLELLQINKAVGDYKGDCLSIVFTRADDTVERQESEPTASSVPARTETTIDWLWYFDELPEKDVVAVCKEHIAKLDALMEECESRFTP